MDHQQLFSFHQKMSDQKIWLAFKGAISQNLLVELGSMVRNTMGFDSKFKRVFAVFVEMTQNVLHYSAEKEQIGNEGEPVGIGVITITEDADSFSISSGNLVEKATGEQLGERCHHISSLNSAELKELYTESRNQPLPQGSKGAGLGLIDIARKSDRPLAYNVSPIDAQHSFFTLTAIITKGEKGEKSEKGQ
jgi:hypothetical protein